MTAYPAKQLAETDYGWKISDDNSRTLSGSKFQQLSKMPKNWKNRMKK